MKKDRTGEINLNTQGEKMTIIAYRCYEDIDVQFEDNTINYNKSYGSFKKGEIKHPFRYEESQSSLCVKTWELWNNKYKVIDIANKMNISDDVVRKYLKIGEECNKCLYKKLNNIK